MLRSRTRPALLATGAAGFLLLYGLEVATERGAQSPGPADSANYTSYALRNDSSTALYVHLCADPACAQLDSRTDWVTVRPGTTADVQVPWDPAEPTGYAVATDTAGSQRCLVLDATGKQPGTVDTPLSSAGHCG